MCLREIHLDDRLDSPLALANSSLGAAIFLAGIAYAFGYLALLKAWERCGFLLVFYCFPTVFRLI